MSEVQAQVLNTQKFKLAAPGSCVVVYAPLSERKIRLLLSLRTKGVGQGLGVTGGGFVKCERIDKSPVGTIVQTADEAHLESLEENGGFETVITADEFLERAQPVATVTVRVSDESRIHAVTMYALRVSDETQWEAFASLPPGVDDEGEVEREGPLLDCVMSWEPHISRRKPESAISLSYADGTPIHASAFFYQHEVHAIALLAWHAEKERLWT